MKKTTKIIGIYYGKSKTGKSYRILYLVDTEVVDREDSDVFEGQKCYTAFAPSGFTYEVGQIVDIVCHKGEAIVID